MVDDEEVSLSLAGWATKIGDAWRRERFGAMAEENDGEA